MRVERPAQRLGGTGTQRRRTHHQRVTFGVAQLRRGEPATQELDDGFRGWGGIEQRDEPVALGERNRFDAAEYLRGFADRQQSHADEHPVAQLPAPASLGDFVPVAGPRVAGGESLAGDDLGDFEDRPSAQ